MTIKVSTDKSALQVIVDFLNDSDFNWPLKTVCVIIALVFVAIYTAIAYGAIGFWKGAFYIGGAVIGIYFAAKVLLPMFGIHVIPWLQTIIPLVS